MITEDYVSYEVAKLLKEKGFDESTNLVWYQHLPESLDCQNLANKKARDYFYYNETTERNSSYENSMHKPEYIHGDIFSCPTHQMAMKYLRKKGIIIIIEYKIFEGLYTFYIIYQSDEGPTMVDSKERFKTYEDTTDAALMHCLTNLI